MASEKKALTPEDFKLNPEANRKVTLKRAVRVFVQDPTYKRGVVPHNMAIPKGEQIMVGVGENRYYDHSTQVAYPLHGMETGDLYVLKREID